MRQLLWFYRRSWIRFGDRLCQRGQPAPTRAAARQRKLRFDGSRRQQLAFDSLLRLRALCFHLWVWAGFIGHLGTGCDAKLVPEGMIPRLTRSIWIGGPAFCLAMSLSGIVFGPCRRCRCCALDLNSALLRESFLVVRTPTAKHLGDSRGCLALALP
jgi:hypothetical protein